MSSFLNIRSLLFGVSAICETQKEMLLLYIVLGLCCATIPQLTDIPTTNIPINNPMNGYIEIEASSNACYDARSRTFTACSGSYDDIFHAPCDGIIQGVKLVHNSGGVQCSSVWTPTNWGLCWHMGVIVMSVSDPSSYFGDVLYPVRDKTDGLYYWNPFKSSYTNDNGGTVPNSYDISGYNHTADYIYLISPNYTVSVTDQFMLQYAEAYARYSASDNIGVGYASVYFLYSAIDYTSNPTVCGHGSSNPSTNPTLHPIDQNGYDKVLASSNACAYSTTWTSTIFNAPYH
eukprot:288583_1